MRTLDTSELGPIRVAPLPALARARRLYADKIEAAGPAYRNAADSIRAGWSNVWIDAGIRAISDTLRLVPDEDGEE